MPKSKSDQPIALDRAQLGSRLHRSRGQSSVLESWRSLGSPQLPGPSFPAYESPPTANRRVHWWGFTTLQDGSRRILPPSGWGHEKAEGVRLDPSSIQKNPGRRAFAKIMLNCLWRKLAQREKMSQPEYISKPSQYFDLITNPNIIVKNVEIFDNECPFILVNYETKLDHIDTHATADVIVVSYVTAYARME